MKSDPGHENLENVEDREGGRHTENMRNERPKQGAFVFFPWEIFLGIKKKTTDNQKKKKRCQEDVCG